MKTAILNFWNSRKNYGVASVGNANVYIKRHHVTTPPAPMELKGGMEVEIDLEINGMETQSTCTFTRRIAT